jgi:membrane protein DedA with SNARE-associated domain
MPWSRFMVSNISGGVLWATLFGVGGYTLGCKVQKITGPMGLAGLIAAALFTVIGIHYFRRHQRCLEDAAERALPGPLEAHRGAL